MTKPVRTAYPVTLILRTIEATSGMDTYAIRLEGSQKYMIDLEKEAGV